MSTYIAQKINKIQSFMITIDVDRWYRCSSSQNWGPAWVYISYGEKGKKKKIVKQREGKALLECW